MRLGESDRYLITLALAHLAVERPGWDDALGRIADSFGGIETFETFKRLRRFDETVGGVVEIPMVKLYVAPLESDDPDEPVQGGER